MKIIEARNVNNAWSQAVELMLQRGERQESRNGNVLVTPFPVMTIYSRPCERVLFDPIRDANPFFHLMEALWMLSGSNDAKFLDRFIKDFSGRYGEDGTMHGAYGHRWRKHFGLDQLDEIVRRLAVDHTDRQCVLSMWDPTRKTYSGSFVGGYKAGGNDLTGQWKDRPCNTQIYFRVVNGALDMTLMCRSNDIMWGAYGANAVHFSFLLEYMAGRIGVPVGKLYQFSNNWHAYEATFQPYVDAIENAKLPIENPYESNTVVWHTTGVDWDAWDNDLHLFTNDPLCSTIKNQWFTTVAAPMMLAHASIKRGQYDVALVQMQYCRATDWRKACTEWIQRKMNRGKQI